MLVEYRMVVMEGLLLFAILIATITSASAADINQATVLTLCVGVSILILLYVSLRYLTHAKKMIRHMTDEIKILPEDLSEKPGDHVRGVARVFYEELSRVKKLLDKKGRMRQELLEIVNVVASNMEFETLLHDLVPKLNEATQSNCSAFYTVNQSTGKLEIKHSVGFSKNIYGEFDVSLNEGFIGIAAAKNEVMIVQDIPDDTVYFVRTFLGKIKPKSLIVVPVSCQDKVTGVLVCASIRVFTREDRDMIDLIRHYLGVAVNNGFNYDRTKRLTNELTFQNKLIQDQHEDMKKRLDEKTRLLSHVMDYFGESCLYVIDARGIVLVWNGGAERMHGIAAGAAIGRGIDRVYEDGGWPAISRHIPRAIKDGAYSERFVRPVGEGGEAAYEIKMTCLYNDAREAIGILIEIKDSGVSGESSHSEG
ncbi:MAG: GAF domain-containing protein [Defluviitaleaceae bacterium]|nr:GAF domain-containing protein [Defluviitaleaceae bacterium]